MTYATDISTLKPVKAMSLFKDVSNAQVVQILNEGQDEAIRQAAEDMAPTLLAIAKGQPYELPTRRMPEQKGGVVSEFFARLGL